MTPKRRRLFWFALSLVSAVMTILWWMVVQFFQDYRNVPSHHLIGNRPSTVAGLKGQGLPFSFLVIGDTRGTETAEDAIKMATKIGGSSFLVILGDFVTRPDLWCHRFFLTEMTVEINPPFPVFLVAGNHDIDHLSSEIKERERRVTPEIYESLYGARNFDFVFNHCLFVLCDVDWREPPGYLNYLRDILTRKAKGKKHIFVFIHYPPKGLADHIKARLPNEKEFFSIVDEHKEITLLFGHHHGYWRGRTRGINVVVTGGGGGPLRRYPSGRFHHILRVTVDHDKVGEEIIALQGRLGLEDLFEEWIFVNLFSILQKAPWILYLVFVVLLTSTGCVLAKLVKTVKKGLK
jgi:predicted phosphodiesterase